jgi:hypothetical protein
LAQGCRADRLALIPGQSVRVVSPSPEAASRHCGGRHLRRLVMPVDEVVLELEELADQDVSARPRSPRDAALPAAPPPGRRDGHGRGGFRRDDPGRDPGRAVGQRPLVRGTPHSSSHSVGAVTPDFVRNHQDRYIRTIRKSFTHFPRFSVFMDLVLPLHSH